MKRIFLLVSLMLPTIVIFAQVDSTETKKKFTLSSVDLSSGKSALSSGIFASFNLSGKRTMTQITLSDERMSLNHFFQLANKKINIGPSVGYFQNVPFGGAIATLSPIKYFSTLHWVGWSFGKPDGALNIGPEKLFIANMASIKFWRVKTNYSLIYFMDLPAKHVASLYYEHEVNKSFILYTDTGYDLTNEKQLLKLGVIWKP